MTKDYPHSKSGNLFKGTISDRTHRAFLCQGCHPRAQARKWSEENKHVPETRKGKSDWQRDRDMEAGWDGAFVDGSCFIYRCALSYLAAGQWYQSFHDVPTLAWLFAIWAVALKSQVSWFRKGLVEGPRWDSGDYRKLDRVKQKVTAISSLDKYVYRKHQRPNRKHHAQNVSLISGLRIQLWNSSPA